MGRPATAPHTDPGRPTGVRHAVVAVATLMSFLLYLDRFCLSFVEGKIAGELGLTERQRGVLLGMFFVSYALAQVPSGWLSDRFGARRMLALYILAWSLFTGLLGLVWSFALLLWLRFGCGLAQAGAYPTSGSVLSKWVPFARRGLASSLVTVGGRLGGAVASGLTASLLGAFAVLGPGGWRPVMLLYGAAGVLVAAVYWFYFRDRPQDHPGCNPAEVALIESGRPASATSPYGRAERLPLRYLLANRSLWFSSVSQFGTNFGWIFVLNSLPRYLEAVHGVPDVERGWMAGVPMFVGMAGMSCGGWLTDRLTLALGLRWGRRLPMALTRFTAMAAYLACLQLGSPWAVTAALAVVTLSVDLGTPATWAFVQDVGGRHVGSVLGWGNMWGNFGAALSPYVFSWFIDAGRWDACFVACAAAFLVSGAAALGVDATSAVVPEAEGHAAA